MTFPKWKVDGNEKLIEKCPNLKNHPEALDLIT